MPEIQITLDDKTSKKMAKVKFYMKYMKWLPIVLIVEVLSLFLMKLLVPKKTVIIQYGFIAAMGLNLLYLSIGIIRVFFYYIITLQTVVIFFITNTVMAMMIAVNFIFSRTDKPINALMFFLPIYITIELAIMSFYIYIINYQVEKIKKIKFNKAIDDWNMREKIRKALQKEQSKITKNQAEIKDRNKREETHQTENHNNKEETLTTQQLFAGIKTQEELKKRYRDLTKIYHTDNQDGDKTMLQMINQQYTELQKKYKE